MDGVKLLGEDDCDNENCIENSAQVFEVEKIIDHDTFLNCVSRCQEGEILFDPDSLQINGSIHSKNVFLIHWKGYSKFERTWEPEENLLWLELLEDYKKRKNIPHKNGVFERFVKKFDPGEYEKMVIMNQKIRHENEYNIIMEKEAAKHRELSRVFDVENMSSGFVESSVKLRGKSLVSKTTQSSNAKLNIIPKKKRNKSETDVPKILTNNMMSEKCSVFEDDNVFEKKKKKRNIFDPPPVKKARNENTSTLLIIENSPIMKCNSNKKVDVDVCGPLPCRSFDTYLELKKRRRCSSTERLNKRWDKKCELELFNRRHFLTNSLERSDEPHCSKQLITATQELEQRIMEMKQKLITCNINAFLQDFDDVKMDRKLKPFLKELVTRFSLDIFEEFKELFDQIPFHLDAFKFLIIQSLVFRCKRFSTHEIERNWVIRNRKSKKMLDLRFVETDEDVQLDELPLNFKTCSPGHFKCTWLGIFLSSLPPNFRFLVSSGKRRNDTNEDGPFRYDIFMHCMHFGADCQKLKFLQYDCPIGHLEDTYKGNVIDHMHIVAIQGSNLQRLQKFVKFGFDINAMAKIGEMGQVVRLAEYIEIWLEKLLENGYNPRIDMIYYQLLIQMIRNITSEMEDLMFTELFNYVTRPSMGVFQTAYEITPPHILRCSPINNQNNGGLGENQVLTCLFSPCGCLFMNGLSAENRAEEEEMCAKKMSKMHRAMQENRGRIILAVLRVEIETFDQERNTDRVTIPRFKVISSDDGFSIEKMTILRQRSDLSADEADLQMVELVELAKPGRHFFVFDQLHIEMNRLLPGMAHIELKGSVEESMNFLVQLVFFKNTEKAM